MGNALTVMSATLASIGLPINKVFIIYPADLHLSPYGSYLSYNPGYNCVTNKINLSTGALGS